MLPVYLRKLNTERSLGKQRCEYEHESIENDLRAARPVMTEKNVERVK